MDNIKCDIRQLEQDNQRIINDIKIIEEQLTEMKFCRIAMKEAWSGSAATATDKRLDMLTETMILNVLAKLQIMAKLENESKDTYNEGENQMENMIANVTVA